MMHKEIQNIKQVKVLNLPVWNGLFVWPVVTQVVKQGSVTPALGQRGEGVVSWSGFDHHR